MLKIGATAINKLYLGATEINKAYLGSNLVYDAAPASSFLLDTYTGAAVAYSLRQIKTGVTNVCRVRRSSDDDESDFTAAQITDGTLTTWTGANDGFVVTWYDQSGNASHATQATTSLQPQLVVSGTVTTTNGLPSIDFLSGNTELRTDTLALNFSTNMSVFGVQKSNASATNSGSILSFARIGTNTYFVPVAYSATSTAVRVQLRWNSTVLASATIADSLAQILFNTYINSDGAFGIGVNGDAHETSTATLLTDDITEIILGQWRATSPAGYFNGLGQEVIVWPSNQSANRTAIETEINTYYDVY